MIKLRQLQAVSVARGRVVLDTPHVTRDAIVTGDGEGHVIGIDRVRLKEAWKKRTKLQVRGGHGDVVFLVYYDEMQAWNSSGSVLWRLQGLKEQPGQIKDCVYVAEPGSELVSLRILSLTSGRELDRFDNCPPGRRQVLESGVVITNPQGTDPLRWFSFQHRQLRWEKHLIPEWRERFGETPVRQPAVVLGCTGSALASTGRHIFLMSLTDGSFTWSELALPAQIPYVTPNVRDGRIYAWTTGPGAARTRVMVDLGSHQVIRERSEPATAENHFLIVDEASGKVVIDRPLAVFGEVFDRFQEPYRGVLCKEHIAFTTRSGLLVVFRLTDGELVWQHQHRDQLFHPVFEDNRLYVAGADGTLVVFEADGGDL